MHASWVSSWWLLFDLHLARAAECTQVELALGDCCLTCILPRLLNKHILVSVSGWGGRRLRRWPPARQRRPSGTRACRCGWVARRRPAGQTSSRWRQTTRAHTAGRRDGRDERTRRVHTPRDRLSGDGEGQGWLIMWENNLISAFSLAVVAIVESAASEDCVIK